MLKYFKCGEGEFMKHERRTAKYDPELKVEAYHFQGIMQKFPNHFHEYYVIGFIEKGRRHLSCNNQEYIIEPGDLLLFNPRDNHACEQIDGKTLDYRCINIEPDIMKKAVLDIVGSEYLPCFTRRVVFHSELVPSLKELHQMILSGEKDFRKEELFFFLLEQMVGEYTDQGGMAETGVSQKAGMQSICDYLEKNYMNTIALDDLCGLTGLSKYYLLRSFTKKMGISPYSYLETIRIGNAKRMLEQGIPPVDVALCTGFSDQSHFSNFFKKFIGLTPKQYMNVFKDSRN